MAWLERFFGLDVFSFSAKWSPYFIAVCLVILIFYHWQIKKHPHIPVPFKQKLLFYLGIISMYLALGSPIDLLGHLIFSAHMMTMTLAYIVAPPLLILGTPVWIWDAIIARLPKQLERLMNPIFTLLLFNLVFSFYHFPSIHDYIMTHYWLHTTMYVVLFITAMMMWWPSVPPHEKYVRLTELSRMGYIFATGILLTPACVLIVFSGTPMYHTYSDPKLWIDMLGYCVPGNVDVQMKDLGITGPEFFNVLPPLHDQQLGGVIMKLIQEGINAALLYYVFTNWYRKERG